MVAFSLCEAGFSDIHLKVNTLDARCIMTVSSKKVLPVARQGSSSLARSALTGSYKSKPGSGVAAQDMVYRHTSGAILIKAKPRTAETLIREAIERDAGYGTTFSAPQSVQSVVLGVSSDAQVGSEAFNRALAALTAEINGEKKKRPAFGIWADKNKDALEIEAELRSEWA